MVGWVGVGDTHFTGSHIGGIHISLGRRVRGYTYHGDTHITVTPVFGLVTTRSFFFLVVEGGWYLLFRGTSKCEYRPVHQDGEFLAKCSSGIISILCFIFVLKVALLFQLFNFVESYSWLDVP